MGSGCHGTILRLAQHWPAFPGGALILAGVDPVHRCGIPGGPGSVDLTDPPVYLASGRHHRCLHLGALALANHIGRLLYTLDDLSGWLPRRPVPTVNAGIGPGHDSAVRGLRQAKHIPPLEPVALLAPGGAIVMGNEDTPKGLVVHHPGKYGLRRLRIDQQTGYLALREAGVGRLEGRRRVFTLQYSTAVSRQHHVLWVLRIHVDVVDDHLRRGHALKHSAAVRGLIQAFGGARVHRVVVGWIQHQHPGPARSHRNALDLLIKLTARVVAVNPRTGTGVDDVRLSGIDDDRKHI